MKIFSWLWTHFRIPLFVLLGICLYLVLLFLHQTWLANIIILLSIALGSYGLFWDTFRSLIKRHFALDYIAILAVIVSVLTGQFLVGAIIALMITSGETLEDYGVTQAKHSLSQLANRIPQTVLVIEKDHQTISSKIDSVKKGQMILVRKGEVIPLDGLLLSENAFIDESSLTGEPYPVEKIKDDPIRSGTVNSGSPIEIRVEKESKDSTYKKIIALVEKAQGEKAPLVRLADKYSTYFTIITFVIAAFAFWNFHTLNSILAVLVVATPCPLIIATPIALLGGVNAASKRRIIIKQLATIESLSRTNAIILDKTGTITLGKPRVVEFSLTNKKESPLSLLSVAEALERNSLHPLAKAIVAFAKEQKAPIAHASHITEIVGKGISGTVGNKEYSLKKLAGKDVEGMKIALFQGKTTKAVFVLEDEVKENAKQILEYLKQLNIDLSMYTGDKRQAAEKIVEQLHIVMDIHAEASPEDKQKGIKTLKSQGKVTAMVGDGINDAPALALADVGMVFSNEEQTAASEAADVVFLGGNFAMVLEALTLAKRTIEIAMQSILWGIGLSIFFMILASFGVIPPLFGAGIQEAIDVAVIINALRAAR